MLKQSLGWFTEKLHLARLYLSSHQRLVDVAFQAEKRRDAAERNAAAMREALEHYNRFAEGLNALLGRDVSPEIWKPLRDALNLDIGKGYVKVEPDRREETT